MFLLQLNFIYLFFLLYVTKMNAEQQLFQPPLTPKMIQLKNNYQYNR